MFKLKRSDREPPHLRAHRSSVLLTHALYAGIGLSVFGSVLQEIYYFKPQVIYVSIVFLMVIAYILGEVMALVLPSRGLVGRFLNPGPLNSKEYAAIVIMASASATTAISTEILAAQRLYYDMSPNPAAAIFLVVSSQLIGYGIAGLLRGTLVRPTKMLWPINLPVNTLLETLHRDKKETGSHLKLFYIVFAVLFVWEVFPEYMFPVLTGVSVFCLAKQDSLVFTNLFGGAQGNEGLGFLSISFDWQYIAGLGSPLWYPLQTLTNAFIGYLGCTILLMALYYANVWNALDFPFLSQLLFDSSSNFTTYVPYNISLILTPENEINSTALALNGIPNLTASYVGYLITTNMGITATLVYMLLWNYDDIKVGWSFASMSNIKKLVAPSTWTFWKETKSQEQRGMEILADEAVDPHYKLMVDYSEVPQWWYGIVLVVSFIISLVTLYGVGSTLPWWGFVLAIVIAAIMILFFGAQTGITGFVFNQQPVAQMLAGYIHPGKPLGEW